MRRVRALLLPALLLAALLGAAPAAVEPGRADSCPPPGGVVTPVGVTDCATLRPGSDVGGCTLNFRFNGSDGHRYFGTAGHCIVGDGTSDTVFAAPRPVARSGGKRIGEYVYAVLDEARDIALIRLDSSVAADPQMPHFGGPTGLFTDHAIAPVAVRHYGRGMAFGDTVPARTGVSHNSLNVNNFVFFGAAIYGDSGSGVTDDKGRAIGVLVSLSAGASGNTAVTRFDYQLPFAERALGITLTLQTAPLL